MRVLPYSIAAALLVAAAAPVFAQQPEAGRVIPLNPIPTPQPEPYTLVPAFAKPAQAPFSDFVPIAAQPKGEEKKGEKQPPKKGPKDDEFAAVPEPVEPPTGLNPRMIGELGFSGFSLARIVVPSIQTTTVFQPVQTFQTIQQVIIDPQTGLPRVINVQQPVTILVPITTQTRTVFTSTLTRVPIVNGGAFKIAENESPLPEDRVFMTYNYYDAIHGPGGTFAMPRVDTTTTTIGGLPATIVTNVPGTPSPSVNLHREMVGFEKSFLDGFMSFGLRAPNYQVTGDFSSASTGDLSLVFKVAPFLDRETGSGISTGLVLTLPTGAPIDTYVGNVHTTLFQPFVGYRLNYDRFFVQGFSSIVLPAGSGVPTLLFNDIGVGYRAYRGQPGDMLTGIIPVLELHLTTPLDHRQAADPVSFSDLLVLTGGVHIGIGPRTTLTFGVTTPIGGQRVYSVEAGAQLNFRF